MRIPAVLITLALLLSGCGSQPQRCHLPDCAPYIKLEAPRKFIVSSDGAVVKGRLNVGRGLLAAATFSLNGGEAKPLNGETFELNVTGLQTGMNTGVATVLDKQGREASDRVEIFFAPGAADHFFISPPEQTITWTKGAASPVAEFRLDVWQMQGAAQFVNLGLQETPPGVQRVSWNLPQEDSFVDRVVLVSLAPTIQVGRHTLTVRGTVRDGPLSGQAATATVFLEVLAGPETEPPTLANLSPVSGSSVSGAAVTLSGVARDNTAVSRVSVSVNGGAEQAAFTGLANPAPFSLPLQGLRPGTNSVVITAQDEAGNRGRATLTLTYSP